MDTGLEARSYVAVITPVDGWWAVRVEGADADDAARVVYTHAHLRGVEAMTRNATAHVLDADPDTLDVVVEVVNRAEWNRRRAACRRIESAASVTAALFRSGLCHDVLAWADHASRHVESRTEEADVAERCGSGRSSQVARPPGITGA